MGGGCIDYVREIVSNGYIIEFPHHDGIKFYVPNFQKDAIQTIIVRNNDFFDINELEYIRKKYIDSNKCILDIGSNVGNHTVYYSKICNASKVYAFEPIKDTFLILEKNIQLNNLMDKVSLYNRAVGEQTGKASIINYTDANTGATHLKEDCDGGIDIISIDEIGIEEEIQFVKIDVEGFEYSVIKGAQETFKKYKPILFVEIFPDQYEKVKQLLTSMDYCEIERTGGANYVFVHKP